MASIQKKAWEYLLSSLSAVVFALWEQENEARALLRNEARTLLKDEVQQDELPQEKVRPFSAWFSRQPSPVSALSQSARPGSVICRTIRLITNV